MSRRALFITLFVSLALNLFIGGLVIGAVAIGRRAPPPRVAMIGGAGPVTAAITALPAEHRRALRGALPTTLRASSQQLREAGRLRRSALMRLSADPVDSSAVLADLARARAIEIEARGALDQRVVTFAATLPLAERERFAQALLPPPRRRRPLALRPRPRTRSP